MVAFHLPVYQIGPPPDPAERKIDRGGMLITTTYGRMPRIEMRRATLRDRLLIAEERFYAWVNEHLPVICACIFLAPPFGLVLFAIGWMAWQMITGAPAPIHHLR